MPIQDIRELVKDKPELLKELDQVIDLAGASQKLKDANADLVKQRETFEKNERELKASFENTKKDLETKLADALKGGKTDDAVVNGLKEQLKQLAEKVETSEKLAAKAAKDKQAMELKSSIISAAGDAISAEKVFTLMTSEGLVGVKEDGTPFYHKLNAEGQPVALKPEEAVSAYLAANEFLKKPSGTLGTGGNPSNGAPNPKTGRLENPEAAL